MPDQTSNYIKITGLKLFIVFAGFLSFLYSNALSQQIDSIEEICMDPNIKTILFYRSDKDLSLPVLFFGDDEKLSLRFDYIRETEEDYYYSVAACSYDWQLNENPEYLYLDGFNNNPVENKYSSFNTTKYYAHFMTRVPSEDFNFLTSGNYILNVYKGSEPDKIVFTRKFCIAETKVEIKGRVKKPDQQDQELQIEIDLSDLDLMNPLGEIKIVVIKNNDWKNKLNMAYKPVLRDDKLYLDLPYQLMTGGGNEFRYFDIKSTKYISDRLDSIKYISPETHFYLKPDKLKQFAPYFSSTDLNGRFYIDMPDAYNRHIESDYVNVHFTLESTYALASEVYIYGALTAWKTDTSNSMFYNPEKGVYERTLFLKQGYYNYAYTTVDKTGRKISFDVTEGNHSETENEYAIFVYLREPMSDFDRLVGFRIMNSTDENK